MVEVLGPWVWVTLAAAAVQTARFMLQKRLKGLGLSTGGATFSRFLFGAPIAGLAAAVLMVSRGYALPELPARFWVFALGGGAAQVTATFLTVALFSLRNFAVGVAFTKTETVQVALFSAVILGETLPAPALAAIGVGVLGVGLLSGAQGGGFDRRAALYGIGAGALFGVSAIGYRGATLALDLPAPEARALLALAFVTAAQALGMALWLRWREAGELARVVAAWRRTIWVGVTGVAGSALWFTAFALENAARVRALGQIEIVFTLLVSALVFRERLHLREGVGIALVVLSVIGIVLAR
ncbi:DMT family transporter [Phaeovulum vinaykumarii]|uniref:EamA-like transporter family protein n=1 Tax=Phaeovulum vinaykumarii TaxID=407234 RepID=A0A1N7KUD2_9RHOB|nr:DMT family transporter [Phaeovulum vinaykumarii]SIS65213.1 EamA-like transporter family protein [Phaeovulum vinaykumarii]SOC01362.1 EamA-like transporter family protein [Phaeovulum vinaykumarii]